MSELIAISNGSCSARASGQRRCDRPTLLKYLGISIILLLSTTLNFASPIAGASNLNKVISFTLIDADGDMVIFPLLDGHTINLAKLPATSVNIRANLNLETGGSVRITLDGSSRIENLFPYAAKGDTEGDYFPWTPAIGVHQLTAVPFSQPNGKGVAGEALSINFTILNEASRPDLQVLNYWDLSNQFYFLRDQGDADKFYFTLESSENQPLPTPCAISTIDDATNDTPAWLAFPGSANQSVGYEFFINTAGLNPGVYSVTVIFGPVQGFDLGIAKVLLEVSDKPLSLLEFNPPGFDISFEQGEDARVEYLLATSDDNENGAAQILAVDQGTNQPATWLGFTSATNFFTTYDFFVHTDMPAGTYQATLYAQAFSSISGKYKNATADLILVLNPAFKVAEFVLINADTDQFMRFLFDGSIINLSTLPANNLNIQARTYPETTGSVQILVNNKSRTENFYPYAAFGDTEGDYFPWIPVPGNYQLKATPFSAPKLKGMMGASLNINISIVGAPPAAEPDLQLITYPNPADHDLLIEIKSFETVSVSLELYSTTQAYPIFTGLVDAFRGVKIPVDASRFKNGIYYLRATSNNGSVSDKLIVAH